MCVIFEAVNESSDVTRTAYAEGRGWAPQGVFATPLGGIRLFILVGRTCLCTPNELAHAVGQRDARGESWNHHETLSTVRK